jgi:hypothetical protein
MNDLNMEAERAAPCPLCDSQQVQVCRDSNNPAKDSARCRDCKCTAPLSVWNRRAAPVGEVELPALPEGDEAGMYKGSCIVIPHEEVLAWFAPYAERIRVLERELATLKGEHATLRPAQSIGDDEQFRKLFFAAKHASWNFDERTPELNALIAYIDGRTAGTAPAVVEPSVGAPRSREWQPVTRPGQVRKGDKLRFKIGNKRYDERAKLILHPGTDKEEVIYDKGRNFYFITAMVMSGFSNHKCVEVLDAAPTPLNSGKEEANG